MAAKRDLPGWRAVLAAAAGNHDVLPAVHHVGGWRGIPGKRQRRLPQQFARQLVERAQLAIEIGGGDEEQAAGGDDGPAVVVAAGVAQALRDELGIFAERNLPANRAGVEIDRVQRAPRRRDRRIAVRIAPAAFRRRCGTSISSDPAAIAGSLA